MSFGGLCLIVALDKKGRSVREVNEVSIELPWHYFVNATGIKEKPIVIRNSANPRYLQRFDRTALPVNYFDQKKSMDDRRYHGIYFN